MCASRTPSCRWGSPLAGTLLLALAVGACGGAERGAADPGVPEAPSGADAAPSAGRGGAAALPGGDPGEPAVFAVRVVFEPTGEPVPGVPYDIISQAGEDWASTRATTGEDGVDGTLFEHGEQINAVVVRSTAFTAPRRVEVGEILVGGERHEIEVAVRPAAGVAGVVLDELGEPVAGAQVAVFFRSVLQLEDEAKPQVDVLGTTDDEGRFRIGGLPQGDFTVEAAMEGMANVRRASGTVEEAQLVDGLELHLEPAHTVYGQVLDPDEEPVAEAQVVAGQPGRRFLQKRRRPTDHEDVHLYPARALITTSDEQGLFTLRGVPDSRTWNLNVRHDDYLPWIGTIPAGEVDVWVQLKRGVAVEGTVSRAEGEPLPAARLWLFAADGTHTARSERPDGAYAIRGLEPDPAALLLAHAPGRQMRLFGPLELLEGTRRLDLTLPPGLVLAGRVEDAQGAPVAGARVHVQGTPPSAAILPAQMPEQVLERSAAMTGTDGTFAFEDLYPGRFTVTVTGPSGARRVIEDAQPDGGPLVVVLE